MAGSGGAVGFGNGWRRHRQGGLAREQEQAKQPMETGHAKASFSPVPAVLFPGLFYPRFLDPRNATNPARSMPSQTAEPPVPEEAQPQPPPLEAITLNTALSVQGPAELWESTAWARHWKVALVSSVWSKVRAGDAAGSRCHAAEHSVRLCGTHRVHFESVGQSVAVRVGGIPHRSGPGWGWQCPKDWPG